MNKLPNCHSESKGDEKEMMEKIQKPFSNHHDHDPDPPKPQDPATMQDSAIATLPLETFFPFFQLSGEIRNQIYLDILGPQLPRPIPEEPAGVSATDVELTTFGLGHRLSRMSHLKQMHLEYHESEDSWEDGYWVRYRDGSLVRHTGNDLKTVFSDDLRGMKLVHVSGTLCDECAALVASAIERPREILPEEYQQEPEKCIPRATVPLWEDKSRRWV
ncbi:MAG: hypothetical protein Q9228_000882 [Teloschistes exilis]